MKRAARLWVSWLLAIAPVAAFAASPPGPAQCRFEVSISSKVAAPAKDGRLFVVLCRTNNPEPRFTLGRTGPDAPEVLARDVQGFAPGGVAVLDQAAFAFPLTNFSALPAGDSTLQAISTACRRRFTSTPLTAAPGSWS
jgi:hypothetical protein